MNRGDISHRQSVWIETLQQYSGSEVDNMGIYNLSFLLRLELSN